MCNLRGEIYLKLKKYGSSLKDFNKTIMIDPSNNTAYNNRAFIYIRLKQYENALTDLNKSVEISENLSQAYKNYAHVFFKLSDIKKAEENILKAIQLDSSNGDNYIILAAINLYNEDYNSCYTNLKLAKDTGINYYDYFDDDIFDKIRHNDEFLSLFGSCPRLF
ncbi:tetratricopeptide repeat protein [Clostridium algidicarnis]|uniref:tetratricopeptide repeat protein n=2 Tax=Clostridium algidicarnis TaxID=37659 RepID=UPI001C0D350E|nr:tetratricopeptide repeat protein [Clostridium algidicarnis]MBU3210648.1 tetratricopeptide repeat protein [Clostridium algidicarnis]